MLSCSRVVYKYKYINTIKLIGKLTKDLDAKTRVNRKTTKGQYLKLEILYKLAIRNASLKLSSSIDTSH